VVAVSGDKIGGTSPFTLGIEEEFHLVDLRTRQLTPRASELLAELAASEHTYAAELQQTVVETNSRVCTSLSELGDHLRAVRAELVSVAGRLGIGVAAAGTMPLSMREVLLTDKPRFRRMHADYQLLVREQLICGMQVHVGIDDRDLAVQLVDRVGPWLPPLLALSVSSPFSHGGEDTGYASSRSLIWSRWPTTGSPGPFASAREYDEMVENLVASGVISDKGMLYFDLRPSAHLPTLELRVCDACHSVDTVALIAGLFRAAVMREAGRARAGESPTYTVHPTLHRASMWRAARSGIEAELVELGAAKSVPAAVVLRSMLEALEPELRASGDWEQVQRLLESALERRSAAARQRDALRRRGRFTDVVDLIVAETRGDKHHPTESAGSLTLSRDYHAPAYDEALLPDGSPRPAHAAVLSLLSELGNEELARRGRELAQRTLDAGVVFRPTDAKEARPFPLDVVPRVLTGEEWSRLEGGTAQRARALDAFLDDVYGEQQIVRDGVVPAWLLETAPGRRDAGLSIPRGARRTQVCGFDIVRDADGRWLVLEDNVRVPSGVGYAIQSRRLLCATFPEYASLADLLDVEAAPRLLRKTLEESAPARAGSAPELLLLSEGSHDSAYFEHQMLAEAAGMPIATPSELLVQDDVLYHVVGEKKRRVDVVYLRMDDALGRRHGKDGRVLGPQLLRAVRAENLALANALGNGVADDKAVYDYVPKLIEYYLGERPLLDQVETLHCADEDQKREVLSRLEELVVKPVDGYGGLGVVVGPHASEAELERARELIEEQPSRWIAQRTISLSTHPTLDDGRLTPRHVDLRVFVYFGAEPVVVPAALTRVAGAGSMVVNSSRGGGAKDTWLLR
jgi:glutamate---cysteine ligase / carboxylate-amine ligase